MSSAAECIRQIQEAGEDLSLDAIEEIVSELDAIRSSLQAKGSIDTIEEALFDAADQMASDAEEAAKIQARNAAINIRVSKRFREFVETVNEQTNNPALAFTAANVGVNAPFASGKLSVDARGVSLTQQYLGGMIADLKALGLLDKYNSRSLTRLIAREKWELSMKTGGTPGLTGSADALAIAKILQKYERTAIARQNRAGAWIRETEGFVSSRNHDRRKINAAGYDQWEADILPKLDTDRSFGPDANVERALRSTYDVLLTGQRLEGAESASDLKLAFKGPNNLAKRVSQHRTLFFKSADDELDYMQKYGAETFNESISSELETAARNTALMETWGPNPRAMYDTMLNEAKTKYRSEAKKFGGLTEWALNNQMNVVDGTIYMAPSPTWAAWGAGIRAVQSMAKLGGATLSAISDVPIKAAQLRFQGRGFLDAWGASVTSFLDGLPSKQRARTAELIGVGLDGQIANLAARYSAQDHLAGNLARMQRIFFKLNLMGPWTDAHKRGMGLLMARDLAMDKNLAFAELPEQRQRLLRQYGIDEDAWKVGRVAVRKGEDGREYLMPDAFTSGAPEIEAAIQRVYGETSVRGRRRIADSLETRFRTYYSDQVNTGVITPGAREQAILTMGTQAGTPIGEAIRFIMQFKAFPVGVISKALGRDLYGHGAGSLTEAMFKGKGDVLGLAQLILGTTVLGYVAQSAKEATKGRSPRDPADPNTWVAAMLQGGGLGIFGDFMFGEFNRFGRSFLDTAAGPTLGGISDMAELWARFRSGDDFAAQTVRFAMSNTPFANLFYTRTALDYLILYNVMEGINPGYLRRMERRIRRENNQTFILPPSSVVSR